MFRFDRWVGEKFFLLTVPEKEVILGNTVIWCLILVNLYKILINAWLIDKAFTVCWGHSVLKIINFKYDFQGLVVRNYQCQS